MLFLQRDQVVGITQRVVPVEVGVFRFRRIFQDRLEFLRQSIELLLVEGDFEAFLRLVEAGQMVVLGNVLHPEVFVRGRVVELGRVDQAALHGGLNFAAR